MVKNETNVRTEKKIHFVGSGYKNRQRVCLSRRSLGGGGAANQKHRPRLKIPTIALKKASPPASQSGAMPSFVSPVLPPLGRFDRLLPRSLRRARPRHGLPPPVRTPSQTQNRCRGTAVRPLPRNSAIIDCNIWNPPPRPDTHKNGVQQNSPVVAVVPASSKQ